MQSPGGGRSRGGMTTKILALTDALGNLVDFRLMPGHLLAPSHGMKTNHCRATDRAFDAGWLRSDLMDSDIIPVIPPKSNQKFPTEFDKETYKWRHLTENYFGKLKENRWIATLPPSSIQPERDSGVQFCPIGRVVQRRLAQSWSWVATSDPVAG